MASDVTYSDAQRVRQAFTEMDADTETGPAGCYPVFALFVPVSSVAKLIGKNPYERVEDVVAEVVAKNKRIVVWRDEGRDQWTPDKVSAALEVSADEEVQDSLQLAGMQREQVLVCGLSGHVQGILGRARFVDATFPLLDQKGFQMQSTVAAMTDQVVLSVAAKLGVQINVATRTGSGMDGVRALLIDQSELILSQRARVLSILGPDICAGSVENAVRIAIASASTETHEQAIERIAAQLGASVGEILRHGYRKGLASVLKSEPSVAKRLPGALRQAAVSEVNCNQGRSAEKRDVDAAQASTGHAIKFRNAKMKYARVYVTRNVAVDTGGRIDGFASDDDGDYIVESKRRTSRFLGIPEYERVQIELYMRLFGVDRCLHVETLGGEQRKTWIFPSPALLADIIKGLCGVVCGQILPHALPAVGARFTPNPFKRFHTQYADDPHFSTDAPDEALCGGLWAESGFVPAVSGE